MSLHNTYGYRGTLNSKMSPTDHYPPHSVTPCCVKNENTRWTENGPTGFEKACQKAVQLYKCTFFNHSEPTESDNTIATVHGWNVRGSGKTSIGQA